MVIAVESLSDPVTLTEPAKIVVAPVCVLLPDSVSEPPVASTVNAPDPESAPVKVAESELAVIANEPVAEKVWTVLFHQSIHSLFFHGKRLFVPIKDEVIVFYGFI